MLQIDAREIGWVKASGTSNREQDVAEAFAIRDVFDSPPPVSSLEPYLKRYANGAAPALGLAAALLCRNAGVIAPTLNFKQPRPGCDLDYVPNRARQAGVRSVVANSIAFGGGSASIIISEPRENGGPPTLAAKRVAITGIGIVSPTGCGIEAFREALRCGYTGIGDIDRWDTPDLMRAGRVSLAERTAAAGCCAAGAAPALCR